MSAVRATRRPVFCYLLDIKVNFTGSRTQNEQPSQLATWCQVELATFELCPKENIFIYIYIYILLLFGIQTGDIKLLSYLKGLFALLPGGHFAAEFSRKVNCYTLVLKIESRLQICLYKR